MSRNTVIGIITISILITLSITTYLLIEDRPVTSTKQVPNQITATNSKKIVAVGDIASCNNTNDSSTAELVDQLKPDKIITLGDNVYDSGKREEYSNCFEESWGKFKEKILPSIGNHDYGTGSSTNYLEYFNLSSPTYYSTDIGNWHLISLDSNCSYVSCSRTGEQGSWLISDLSKVDEKSCVLAYMHHPLFSSGITHGNQKQVKPLWEILYEYNTDIVLAGHDHTYERFAPQDPSGALDNEKGIVSFVVGTGGRSLYNFKLPRQTNSLTSFNKDHGVLGLTLKNNSYDWEFKTINNSLIDTGTKECKN